MAPANDVIACAVAQPHAKARGAQSAAGKCVAGMSMGEVDVVSDVKRCSVRLLGVGMDARAAVVEHGRRRLAKRDHAPLGRM